MFVVQPKAPQGFKDYLMVNGNYVLEGNAASRLSVPVVSNAATEILLENVGVSRKTTIYSDYNGKHVFSYWNKAWYAYYTMSGDYLV